MAPHSSLSEPKAVLQLSSPDVPHQANAVSLQGLISDGSSFPSRQVTLHAFVPLSLCTYYSFCLEHRSLSFVPSEAYPCVDGSSASLALGVSPQGPGCSCLRSLERLPHRPSSLLQHWVWFSMCGPQRAPGSGWSSLCQHSAALPHVYQPRVTCQSLSWL